jgi:hypothetical protein
MTFKVLGGWIVFLATCATAFADDAPVSQVSPATGVKRALVLCGHPGDEEHRTLYAESLVKLHRGLTEQLGFRSEDVVAFFGVDAEKEAAQPLSVPVRGPGTREALTAAVQSLREQTQPDDALWVIVLGHAHFDGRNSWLNLPGPDLHQDDFGKLFRDLACREQLFWITTPASGYYLKPLAAKGRVVISATEADLEVNETLFPHHLADALNPPADKAFEDVDRDGKLTAFDLHIAVVKSLAQRYLADMLIATEHALLDDNGDGRGTELQLDYLTEEEGGRPRRDFQPTHRPGTDGAAAATVLWPRPNPQPAPTTPQP